MPAGIVTTGVILQAFGGHVRKSKRFRPQSLPFRPFLIATGAVLVLTAAFLPQANANFCPPGANCSLIQHFNFNNDAGVGNAPPYTSVEGGATLFNDPVPANSFPPGNINVVAAQGTLVNAVPGDLAGAALDVRGNTSGVGTNYCFRISPINTSGFSVVSVSFAIKSVGSGQFTQFTLGFSTNGGASFTPFASNVAINQDGNFHLVHAEFNVPGGATNVVLQFCFTGSTNNASPNNTYIDNIEIDAVIPEPATVASGVLGIMGLCWHQRRRLKPFLLRCSLWKLRRA